ncbi:MAG TPA: AMP-binding protein, partial [Candidatus Dormibacteraeota bacterium]|nr:AMP-binding protein [Candidatus Dormibacteraeota bacterium]
MRPASRTLPDLLDELTARQPDHELIVGGGERLSYAETRERARRLAKGLRRLGVTAGDRVALVMTNRPEWLLIDFAVMMLGATLVPISTWSRPRELEYVLAHCGVTTLVTIPRLGAQRFLDAVGEMGGPGGARLPDLRRVVVAGSERPPGAITLDDLGELGRDVPDAEIDAAQRAVTPEDVACILYTSGTTSTPKGVQLCHGGLIENMWNIGERQHLTPADRMWMGISL